MDSTKLRVRVRSERKPKSIGKSFYILVTYLEDEYVYNFFIVISNAFYVSSLVE